MRVSILAPAPPLRGGISMHAAGLADALEDKGHDARVISYSRLYPDALFPGRSMLGDSRAVGTRLLDVMDPRSWAQVRRRLTEDAADLVVFSWWHPGLAPILAYCLGGVAARKTVALCHNAGPHEPFPWSQRLTRCALRRCGLAITHSAAVSRQLSVLLPAPGSRAGNLPFLRVETTPMPVLVSPGVRLASRRAAREELGIPGDAKVAALLGHLRGYKGVDLLFRAWERAALPAGARLLIAGESYLRAGTVEGYLTGSSRRDSIILKNQWLSERTLLSYLNAVDCLVLPYRSASQSGMRPLADALGLRCVVSSIGGLGESPAGAPPPLVFPAGNVDALAEVLGAVMHEIRPEALPGISTHGEAQAGLSVDSATEQRAARLQRERIRSWRPTIEVLEHFARL